MTGIPQSCRVRFVKPSFPRHRSATWADHEFRKVGWTSTNETLTELHMRIRPFQPDDLESVAALFTAAVHTLAAPYYSTAQLTAWAPIPPDPEWWRRRLTDPQTLVMEECGRLSGFVSFTSGGYLDMLFTHPDFARRGIARQLYLKAESIMVSSGARLITTHASLAARDFFESVGFHTGQEEVVECRGSWLRRFAMSKIPRDPIPALPD
jgi:putative acetyltransferase